MTGYRWLYCNRDPVFRERLVNVMARAATITQGVRAAAHSFNCHRATIWRHLQRDPSIKLDIQTERERISVRRARIYQTT